MKKLLLLLPLILGLTLLYSCSGTAQHNQPASDGSVPTAVTKPITDAKPAPGPGIRNINPDEFNKLREENPDAIVIDVRTPGEFTQGSIDGAINIDLRNPNFAQNINSLDKNQTYLVYCRTGKRSASACQIMQEEGFGNLYNLQGGITAWQAAK